MIKVCNETEASLLVALVLICPFCYVANIQACFARFIRLFFCAALVFAIDDTIIGKLWNELSARASVGSGHVGQELGPHLENVPRHCPSIDILDTLIEGRGGFELLRVSIAEVAIPELKRPEYIKTGTEQPPEHVGAVLMLLKYETFAQTRPWT